MSDPTLGLSVWFRQLWQVLLVTLTSLCFECSQSPRLVGEPCTSQMELLLSSHKIAADCQVGVVPDLLS